MYPLAQGFHYVSGSTLPLMFNDIRVKWPSEHSEWLLEAVAAISH
jgi:hypothetical protein